MRKTSLLILLLFISTASAAPASVPVASEASIPVITTADVLVVGGSLDGFFLAERLAREGKKVVITSPHNSIPRELVIALRPWINKNAFENYPQRVKDFLRESSVKKGTKPTENETSFLVDLSEASLNAENALLDAGAKFFYGLHPCGVKTVDANEGQSKVAAVIFGCKGGLVAISAETVVDATVHSRVANLAGAKFTPRHYGEKNPFLATYSMHCEGIPRGREDFPVENVPELLDSRILFHLDRYAEFRIATKPPTGDFKDALVGLELRRVAVEAGKQIKGMQGFQFSRGGDTAVTSSLKRLVSRGKGAPGSMETLRPEKIVNLYVCSANLDQEKNAANKFVNPLEGAFLFPLLAEKLTELSPKEEEPSADEGKVVLSDGKPAETTANQEQAWFTELPPIYREKTTYRAKNCVLPVVDECDVLVVGAGTSGCPAATVAARAGVKTIALEMHGDVGGTHTIGGVSKYWFGRKTNFFNQFENQTQKVCRETKMPPCIGWLDVLQKSGAKVITHCVAVGTVVMQEEDAEKVTGVVVVTPDGLAAIRAKRIVDATGDADVVARAGAAATYGTERDTMALWYSFTQFNDTRLETPRHFAFAVDTRDPTDFTRAIITGRRYVKRKPKDVAAPQYYFTPRETRRLQGKYQADELDALAERRFEDLIAICQSDIDIKGMASSDLSFSGYIEWTWLKNHSVQTPYRALLPEELENVLVVGKAHSVTHDVQALARMQRDMMAIGAAGGMIAAESVQKNIPLEKMTPAQFHAGLLKLGVLSHEDLQTIRGVKDNALPELSLEALQTYVAKLARGEWDLAEIGKILARPAQSVPMLRDALETARGKGQLEVARALCHLGDPPQKAKDILLAELKKNVAEKKLPGMSKYLNPRLPHPLPEHGFAADPANLVHLLSRLGDKRVLPLMKEIAKKLVAGDSPENMVFSYVFSLAYAAEHLKSPEAVEALLLLSRWDKIRGSSVQRGADPRQVARGLETRLGDRSAYLELCLGRALAHCGSKRGYEILLEYLGDVRGFLARSAHDELVLLTGKDGGSFFRRQFQDAVTGNF